MKTKAIFAIGVCAAFAMGCAGVVSDEAGTNEDGTIGTTASGLVAGIDTTNEAIVQYKVSPTEPWRTGVLVLNDLVIASSLHVPEGVKASDIVIVPVNGTFVTATHIERNASLQLVAIRLSTRVPYPRSSSSTADLDLKFLKTTPASPEVRCVGFATPSESSGTSGGQKKTRKNIVSTTSTTTTLARFTGDNGILTTQDMGAPCFAGETTEVVGIVAIGGLPANINTPVILRSGSALESWVSTMKTLTRARRGTAMALRVQTFNGPEMCMRVGAKAPGANPDFMVQEPCDPTDRRQKFWTLPMPTGDWQNLVSDETGLCVSVLYSYPMPTNPVFQLPCMGLVTQQFKVTQWPKLTPYFWDALSFAIETRLAPGYCLGISDPYPNTTRGALVLAEPCKYGDWARWDQAWRVLPR